LFSVILNTVFTSKVLNVSFMAQLKDISSIFLNSAIMSILVYVLSFVILNDIAFLVVGILVGLAYYLFSSKLFFKDEMQNVMYMLKKKTT